MIRSETSRPILRNFRKFYSVLRRQRSPIIIMPAVQSRSGRTDASSGAARTAWCPNDPQTDRKLGVDERGKVGGPQCLAVLNEGQPVVVAAARQALTAPRRTANGSGPFDVGLVGRGWFAPPPLVR